MKELSHVQQAELFEKLRNGTEEDLNRFYGEYLKGMDFWRLSTPGTESTRTTVLHEAVKSKECLKKMLYVLNKNGLRLNIGDFDMVDGGDRKVWDVMDLSEGGKKEARKLRDFVAVEDEENKWEKRAFEQGFMWAVYKRKNRLSPEELASSRRGLEREWNDHQEAQMEVRKGEITSEIKVAKRFRPPMGIVLKEMK